VNSKNFFQSKATTLSHQAWEDPEEDERKLDIKI
jgi:hypothetical protein